MKLILLEEVKGTGKKGQIVEVSAGHAANFLIPRKLAVEATKENLKRLEEKNRTEENKRLKAVEEATAVKAALAEKVIVIKAKTGESGKMFGSISSREVAEAIDEQTGIKIDKKKLVCDPIKTTGEKVIELKLPHEVTARVTVRVVGEN